MITFGDYKHIIPIQVRFSDIDRLNHVNNACYLNYFELGRVQYFTAVLSSSINWNTHGFVAARTEIDHLAPVFLNDEIYCCSRVIRLGNKSLTIKNSIVKKENDTLIEWAAGIGILVAMDYVNNVSIELPGEWRKRMEAFES